MAKTVIYVEIPRSIMVHASNGRYYQRVGSTKQEMKPEVLMRLFQQRSQSRLIRFDETLVPATTAIASATVTATEPAAAIAAAIAAAPFAATLATTTITAP